MGEFKWKTMHGTFELPRSKRQIKAPATSVSLVGKLTTTNEGYNLAARSGTVYHLREDQASNSDFAKLAGLDVRVRGLFSLSDMTIVVESIQKNGADARIWPPKVRS